MEVPGQVLLGRRPCRESLLVAWFAHGELGVLMAWASPMPVRRMLSTVFRVSPIFFSMASMLARAVQRSLVEEYFDSVRHQLRSLLRRCSRSESCARPTLKRRAGRPSTTVSPASSKVIRSRKLPRASSQAFHLV